MIGYRWRRGDDRLQMEEKRGSDTGGGEGRIGYRWRRGENRLQLEEREDRLHVEERGRSAAC